jgi:NADH:ubiquinone reductase (non-electrogenic)
MIKVAERQGKYLTKQLSGNTKEEFTFTSAGMLAYIGSYDGLTDLPKTKLQGEQANLKYFII